MIDIPEDAKEFDEPIIMYKDGLKFYCHFEEGDKIFCSYDEEKDFLYVFKKDEMSNDLVNKIETVLEEDDED